MHFSTHSDQSYELQLTVDGVNKRIKANRNRLKLKRVKGNATNKEIFENVTDHSGIKIKNRGQRKYLVASPPVVQLTKEISHGTNFDFIEEEEQEATTSQQPVES